jgi:hypothetical protein
MMLNIDRCEGRPMNRAILRAGASAAIVWLWTAPGLAADCTQDGLLQVHDLALFSQMADMVNCSTPAGQARYLRNIALLKTLNERNEALKSVCADSDPRWIYARKTLEIQTRIFVRLSKNCTN